MSVEPSVRFGPSLTLICLLACQPVCAMTFQTRLEKVEWAVEGDKFECRLIQPISQFGVGEFVRRAGERPTFRLKAHERWLADGNAVLLAAAAPWRPGVSDISLGQVRVASGAQAVNTSQEQGTRLIKAMLEGRSPVIKHRGPSGEALEVRLLPVRFNQAYEEYTACTANLLPVNFDQIRHTEVGFPGGGYELDAAAKARLDIVLDYLQEDPSVSAIQLDGHSDNSGNRLENRDLSRRRALAVSEYLQAHGFAEERIVLRFHGESYPKVANTNAQARAKNRRVSILLKRDARHEPTQQAGQPALKTNGASG